MTGSPGVCRYCLQQPKSNIELGDGCCALLGGTSHNSVLGLCLSHGGHPVRPSQGVQLFRGATTASLHEVAACAMLSNPQVGGLGSVSLGVSESAALGALLSVPSGTLSSAPSGALMSVPSGALLSASLGGGHLSASLEVIFSAPSGMLFCQLHKGIPVGPIGGTYDSPIGGAFISLI